MAENYAKRTNLKRSLKQSKPELVKSGLADYSESDPGSSFSQIPRKKSKLEKSVQKKKNNIEIEQGRVLICLTGKHRGKRVIFLKQLVNSGLLLITGPYQLNGVPLRRVHAKSVIKTETVVEIPQGFQIPENINDSYFSQPKVKRKKIDEILEEKTDSKEIEDERKKIQKDIDSSLLSSISVVPYLKDYLKQRFSLSKSQLPHKLLF